jgi:hypothetical protein
MILETWQQAAALNMAAGDVQWWNGNAVGHGGRSASRAKSAVFDLFCTSLETRPLLRG